MIDPAQLKKYVIEPVLASLGSALNRQVGGANLVLATAAVESKMGTYLVQLGGGPALGIYQCEPATHDDLLANYVAYRPAIGSWLMQRHSTPHHSLLVTDLWYATAICRLHYMRQPAPLPADDDWPGMARYWKAHYNTALGKGTDEHFLAMCAKAGLIKGNG